MLWSFWYSFFHGVNLEHLIVPYILLLLYLLNSEKKIVVYDEAKNSRLIQLGLQEPLGSILSFIITLEWGSSHTLNFESSVANSFHDILNLNK